MGPSPSRALERASVILDLFSTQRPEWSVTEIARATSRSLAATHRTLAALELAGYLERSVDRGPFRLGLRLLQLGAIVAARLEIAQVCEAPITRLVAELGDTAAVVVPDRSGVVCVRSSEGTFRIRPDAVRVGERMPYHVGAIPMAVFAFLPPEDRAELLTRPLEQPTAHTVTDPATIERRVREIQAAGLALTFEEAVLGTAAAAAPVFGVDGKIAGSIGVTGIQERFIGDRRALVEARIREAALDLSRRLGYRPGSGAVAAGE